uniref:YLP motif-containing protein 1 n=2 Tax=Fopius arisanus TaxID=64838 RepID=A0A0C9QNT3_9HYME
MQNWNPWQLPTATPVTGSMPQTPGGSGYPPPGADPMATMQAYMQYYNQPAPSGYTAEQWSAAQQQNWAQWQQWQQQYQQWQAQYGAKYQDAMKQMSSAGVSGVPPVVQPPPLPKENSTAKPPLPPDNASYGFNGILPPHQNNLPLFPSKNANPPLPLGPPPPPPDNAHDGLNSGKRSADTDIVTDSAKKLKNEEDELTEAERTFDAQFKQWEEQFNKWKQQNANHPDKAQYKQYEAKWTAWREKLIERRDQMRKKREAQRAKIEAERKKNMPGGDKILNILSSTENQGLLNNLLGIGKTLGLTGKDVGEGQPPQTAFPPAGPAPPALGPPAMQTQPPPIPNMPDITQSPWGGQQWPGQYNMGNMPMPGYSNFSQPPPLLPPGNQPMMPSTMPPFNPPPNLNTNFSQPPPGFNSGFPGPNPQINQNSRDQGGSGRREDGPPNMPFKRDSYDQNQQNRFNDRGTNDQFRGHDQFNRDGNRGISSGGMNQGDGRGDFSNDRFGNDGRDFGGRSDFRSDSFAPKDRFSERSFTDNRLDDQKPKEQDRFGNRGAFESNFERPQDRFGGDRFSGNDRFGSGNNRFDDKDRFGGDRAVSDDRMGSGDRFGGNINRFDSTDSNDRRDNFGGNSRNFGKSDRFDGPPEMSPELKALMEKRRAALNVFKPSGSFLSSEKSGSTFGSLGESFRKITGNAPFLPRDRPGDRGSRSGPFSGPDNGPLSRSGFSGGPNIGPDNSSYRPPFSGGPDNSSFRPSFSGGPDTSLSRPSFPGGPDNSFRSGFSSGPNSGPDNSSFRPSFLGGPNSGPDSALLSRPGFPGGPNTGPDNSSRPPFSGGPDNSLSRPQFYGGPNSGSDNTLSRQPFSGGPNSGPDNSLSRPPFSGGLNSGPDKSSSRPPFSGGPNSGPDNSSFNAQFSGGPNSSDNSLSRPPFSGGPNSGPDGGPDQFRDDLRSRGDTFRSRGDFESQDMGPHSDDFGSRGGNAGARGGPPLLDTSPQKVPPLEVPPWIDPNMMKSPMGLSESENLNKEPDVSNPNELAEKDKPGVNPNASSSPIPEPLMKKPDGLPFMGENDPKPEDLNMEPPPELPDLGPVKQTNQMVSEPPLESNPPSDSFDRPSNFFNGPFGNRGMDGDRGMAQGGPSGYEGGPRGPNEPPFGMRNMSDSNFSPRGPPDGPFGPRPNPGSFAPRMEDRFRKDFGPRSSNLPFGPRDNEGRNEFGPRNPPFGREHDDFGGRGPNSLGPRDSQGFGPRGPNFSQPFAPRGPNSQFGSRNDEFGPRNLPFGPREGDNFGPRGNAPFRPNDNDSFERMPNFGSRGPNDLRDRPIAGDNFMPRPFESFGPPRPLGSNFGPDDKGPRPLSALNMDGPMNQSRGNTMGGIDRDRPYDRFRDEVNQSLNKPMDDSRPPIGGPQGLDRRSNFPRPNMDREPTDPTLMNRDDRGPFMRPDDAPLGRPPPGPMQKNFDGPIDDPRDAFSRRNDQVPSGDRREGPIREFCVEKQFNYNHGGGVPDQVFNEYIPSKVIDYGHIRRPAMQDYATPAQTFDYSHGKFKLRAPDHEIFPKLDFKHWVENDGNLREYDEGMKDYESRKKHARMLRQPEARMEPRMDDRWKREGPRDFGGRYPSWEKPDSGRSAGPRGSDYREYRDHDEFMDSRDSRNKRGRGRSWERDSVQRRDEKNRRSASKDGTREKYERSRKDTDSEFNVDDERSKGNVSRQENSTKTPTESSPPKDSSTSTCKNDDGPPKTLELGKTPNYTMVDDLLCCPGRQTRPPKIAIILRGPPGCGKSFVAKLIKDKELDQGGSAPRILSLDDYFLVEKDVETKDDNGKRVINKEMVYEYEEAMEPSYVTSLVKAFKKNITDGFFNFIILDAINEKISDYEELWSFAKTKGFKVYVCEMDMDVAVCLKRNVHNRTEDEINRIIDYFEPTPSYHQKLDVSSLLQEDAIEEVQMEEAPSSNRQGEGNDDSQDSQDDGSGSTGVSKWEKMEAEDKLDRLDGLKRKNDGKPQTMEDFLQVPDYYDMEDNSGKKRVRWADLEERKEQEKMRAVGFVVGQTNWNRMMDPTKGGSALTRTKYI